MDQESTQPNFISKHFYLLVAFVLVLLLVIGLYIASRVKLTSLYASTSFSQVLSEGSNENEAAKKATEEAAEQQKKESEQAAEAAKKSSESDSKSGSSNSSQDEDKDEIDDDDDTATSSAVTNTATSAKKTSSSSAQTSKSNKGNKSETEIETADGQRIKTKIEDDGTTKVEIESGKLKLKYVIENGKLVLKIENESGEEVELSDDELSEIENELEDDGFKIALGFHFFVYTKDYYVYTYL